MHNSTTWLMCVSVCKLATKTTVAVDVAFTLEGHHSGLYANDCYVHVHRDIRKGAWAHNSWSLIESG